MYPPVETPTSPNDQNMVILDGLDNIPTIEQIPKMLRNPFKHASDTLQFNNMDNRVGDNVVREMELKRTSLKLDCYSTKALDDNDLLRLNKRYSLNDRDLIMAMSKRKSNTYSNTTTTVTAGADDPSPSTPLLDNQPRVAGAMATETTNNATTTSGSQSKKDENENYCDGKEIDNKNGNDRIMDCGQLARVADNDINVDRNSIMDGDDGNTNRHSATTCEENEDEEENYHRLITEEDADSDSKGSAKGCGGASNSSSCCLSSGGEECIKDTRNSIASSSDESVELREKLDQEDELQDEFDEQRELLFGQQHQRHSRRFLDNTSPGMAGTVSAEEPMDILSPNEGPLARRYAEIAQFNGKW